MRGHRIVCYHCRKDKVEYVGLNGRAGDPDNEWFCPDECAEKGKPPNVGGKWSREYLGQWAREDDQVDALGHALYPAQRKVVYGQGVAPTPTPTKSAQPGKLEQWQFDRLNFLLSMMGKLPIDDYAEAYEAVVDGRACGHVWVCSGGSVIDFVNLICQCPLIATP